MNRIYKTKPIVRVVKTNSSKNVPRCSSSNLKRVMEVVVNNHKESSKLKLYDRSTIKIDSDGNAYDANNEKISFGKKKKCNNSVYSGFESDSDIPNAASVLFKKQLKRNAKYEKRGFKKINKSNDQLHQAEDDDENKQNQIILDWIQKDVQKYGRNTSNHSMMSIPKVPSKDKCSLTEGLIKDLCSANYNGVMEGPKPTDDVEICKLEKNLNNLYISCSKEPVVPKEPHPSLSLSTKYFNVCEVCSHSDTLNESSFSYSMQEDDKEQKNDNNLTGTGRLNSISYMRALSIFIVACSACSACFLVFPIIQNLTLLQSVIQCYCIKFTQYFNDKFGSESLVIVEEPRGFFETVYDAVNGFYEKLCNHLYEMYF